MTQTTETPTADTSPLYDLRAFLKAVGGPSFASAGMEPPERHDSDAEVELLEDKPAPVAGDPLPAVAFVDGIQNSFVVTHREHRPVVVSYTAAGAIGAGAKLIGLREQLAIVASEADAQWLSEVNAGPGRLPILELEATSPPLVERAAVQKLTSMRTECELGLGQDLLEEAVGPFVVDGSLLRRTTSPHIYGVVKTTETRYLPDETILYGLRRGWRSPIFKIAPQMGTAERYSCYVRLHDASRAGWAHGLIRIEAFTPDGLLPLAALALVEKQGPGGGDHRWDRHLVSVATCEKVLRARRPLEFDYVR